MGVELKLEHCDCGDSAYSHSSRHFSLFGISPFFRICFCGDVNRMGTLRANAPSVDDGRNTRMISESRVQLDLISLRIFSTRCMLAVLLGAHDWIASLNDDDGDGNDALSSSDDNVVLFSSEIVDRLEW